MVLQENIWIGVATFAGVIVVLSSYADRRRTRRSDIDRVGFMPWTAITVMAVLATVLSVALAIKGA